MSTKTSEIKFPQLVQNFFSQRLIAQRNASTQTVASYRDAFRLLLRYAENRTNKTPTNLTLDDLDAPFILDFLDHLESKRHNSVRSRNARLVAIRSFMRYVSWIDPAHLQTAQRVLAIPMKRFDRPIVGFLSREEVDAIIAAPDLSTWSGHRDHVMFMVLYNTGARVSEVTRLQRQDLDFNSKGSLRIHGKGRKQRAVPLWKKTIELLKNWLPRVAEGRQCPIFPNRIGRPLSRSGVEQRLRKAVELATQDCPTLRNRKVSPHTFRHTTAMHLLQSGVDITVIALWLGHASPATTHQYVEADLVMKERALNKLQEPTVESTRYQATDSLLAFLEGL